MPNQNQTANIGVNRVESLILELNWIFREQLKSDYGIDAHIEINDCKYPTGKLIAVQIKTGVSYFKKNKVSEYTVYRGEMKHLEYWLNHSLPVIIVLYNPETKQCIWEHVTTDTAKIVSKSEWEISISNNNILNEESKSSLVNLAGDSAEYRRKFKSRTLVESLEKTQKNLKQIRAIEKLQKYPPEFTDEFPKKAYKKQVELLIPKKDSYDELPLIIKFFAQLKPMSYVALFSFFVFFT